MDNDEVAVKIFPLQDRDSWVAEQDIYQLPRMDHENILHFMGVDKRGVNLQQEYWLMTKFHQKGTVNIFQRVSTFSSRVFLSFRFTV